MTIESAPDLPSQLAVKVMHEIGSNDPDLYGRLQETLDAALAAAPQPAPDREALVEAIEALPAIKGGHRLGETPAEYVSRADVLALLARGLHLPHVSETPENEHDGGDVLSRETMAWAVVGSDGLLKHVTGNSRQLAQQWAGLGDSIERVAFRRVEGAE